MTPEAQRIAIAEACGATWNDVPPYEDNPNWTKDENDYSRRLHPKRILSFKSNTVDPYSPGMPAPLPFPDPKTGNATSGIPDYLNDLNAMHEAVQCLRPHQSTELAYYDNLENVVQEAGGTMDFDLVNATAAQRAEAFLKTLNLWKP